MPTGLPLFAQFWQTLRTAPSISTELGGPLKGLPQTSQVSAKSFSKRDVGLLYILLQGRPAYIWFHAEIVIRV